MTCLSKSI